LEIVADTRPPGMWQNRQLTDPGLQIRSASAEAIEARWSGVLETGWEGVIDGARFVVERGIEADHRFVHGAQPGSGGAPTPQTRAIHHLSADTGVLSCAPTERSEPSWWRIVLDSVLFTVALLRGYEALHAGAVATPEGAIAIMAGSGGGKSSLLAELLGRGYTLMADDVLVLDAHGDGPTVAHPGPPLMTVPTTRLARLQAAVPVATIASLEDECWVGIPVSPRPLTLKALVLLERKPATGTKSTLTKIDRPLSQLLGSLMGFPRSPERERARFELASVLAGETNLWRLTADLQTSPSVLADVLLAGKL
jgi:hypothetical protein